MEEMLLVVDEKDNFLRYATRNECHTGNGLLHRAFSIFIFNNGRMLIQKRSGMKKTWPLHWTNACCSHPKKGEDNMNEVTKIRLKEEFGVSCDLQFLFKFQYNANFDNNWCENELDWVFMGECSDEPKPNKNEIDDYKFIDLGDLEKDVKDNPDKYTPWFKLSISRVLEHYRNRKVN